MKPKFTEYRQCPGGYRIYYKQNEYSFANNSNDSGFEFEIWEVEGCDAEIMDGFDWPENWHQDGVDCNLIAEGVALFDGIRHLHFPNNGRKNDSYLYYPDLRFVQVLIDMEREFCMEGDSSQKGR